MQDRGDLTLPDFGPRLEPSKGRSADANLLDLMIANTRCPGRPGSVADRAGFGSACRCCMAAPRHISGMGLLTGQSRIPAIEAGAITLENLQEE